MQRRDFLVRITWPQAIMLSGTPAIADSSSPQLASYYERHMVLLDGVSYGWTGRSPPVRMRARARQVGVSRDAYFALLDDERLVSWSEAHDSAITLASGVAAFASGQSGWFAIDRAQVLWHGGDKLPAPQRVADDVVTACIGDSADYFIRRDGTLWVKGLAHRGQYGDGRLTSTADFVSTARDAVAVRAHTGHAIYLTQGGVVMGTGGNRFGPLGTHGLGDKAERWGRVFEGAIDRASLCIRMGIRVVDRRMERCRPLRPARRDTHQRQAMQQRCHRSNGSVPATNGARTVGCRTSRADVQATPARCMGRPDLGSARDASLTGGLAAPHSERWMSRQARLPTNTEGG